MTRLVLLFITSIMVLMSTPIMAAGDPVAGQEKSAPCQACHGPDGNSTDPQFPRLAGQYANYLVRALEEYQTGIRKNPIMAGFAATLTAQDRQDLAAFYSGQPNGLYVIGHGP
ncbi:MAG: cytochrome c [Gammaproteobacteria bacterium]|jgi:cytochrome c553